MSNLHVKRQVESALEQRLRQFPVVVLIGSRQVGKSTLAQTYLQSTAGVYLDLERASDRLKLQDPAAFWNLHRDTLICIDEVQLGPDLYPELRSFVDESKSPGQFLLLGSASRDLIQQSAETLAGRIAYLEVHPLTLSELAEHMQSTALLQQHWLRGGYPLSYLAPNHSESLIWRLEYIQSYLFRDLPMLGFKNPPKEMERLWKMCAHMQGQTLNTSKLSGSMGISHHMIRRHLEWLEETFVIRLLKPFSTNLKKRLVKTPKLYLRDSGLLHALLGIQDEDDLLGHPVRGASFEGYVIESLLQHIPPGVEASFYRTSHGAEIDLILERGLRRVAVEIKVSTGAKPSKGFYQSCEELEIQHRWVITPADTSFPGPHQTDYLSVLDAIARLDTIFG